MFPLNPQLPQYLESHSLFRNAETIHSSWFSQWPLLSNIWGWCCSRYLASWQDINPLLLFLAAALLTGTLECFTSLTRFVSALWVRLDWCNIPCSRFAVFYLAASGSVGLFRTNKGTDIYTLSLDHNPIYVSVFTFCALSAEVAISTTQYLVGPGRVMISMIANIKRLHSKYKQYRICGIISQPSQI